MTIQACIGPSQAKVHLRDTGKSADHLTLCQRTAPVRDYKGQLAAENLCRACAKVAVERLKDRNLTAVLLGVSEIV